MSRAVATKLWVIKFCLKVIYPKYNTYLFLVFLAIKFRIYLKRFLSMRAMDAFLVKTAPFHIIKRIARNHLDDNLPVLFDKCLYISREQYIQLCAQNLFYIDNGVVWLATKLKPEIRIKYKHKVNTSRGNQIKLAFLASEVQKKLWIDSQEQNFNNVKVVPVVGSKLVPENIAYTTETEFYNLACAFSLEDPVDTVVTFHPVLSLENGPKIAATAEVSLIVNEYDLSNDFVKEVLNNYFEKPQLISVDDVFSIRLDPMITGKYHYKYLDLVDGTGKLHFKCSTITCEMDNKNSSKTEKKVIQPYYIVRGVTQLTLGENIHIEKPRDQYFNPQGEHNSFDFLSLCPTGLMEMFKMMQDTISPFLTGDLSHMSTLMSTPIIPMLLLTGPLGSGRHMLVKILAKFNGLNCLHIDCHALQSSTAKQTESKINSTIQKAKAAAPVIVLLDNFEVFAVDPENNEDCRVMEYFLNLITDLYQHYTKHTIIFIAVTERVELKSNVLRMFLEKFNLSRPSLQQRYEMLQWFASVMQLKIDDEQVVRTNTLDENRTHSLSQNTKDILQRIAAKSETFLYGDLDTLLHFALRESYLNQNNRSLTDPDLHYVQECDFNNALESIRSLQSQHLDAPKIPKVYWEDIGGLEKLKKELMKTIEFPIKYPHLFKNSSLKRSGILLYGPPGCGKTLVAKAVSTELNVSFMSVKGPELLNMYIGQSEENVRKVFESARAASPCIVFLDELDALAPRRGAAGDSGGASDRVVSQLLAELDGVTSGEDAESTSFVFVMGATNRPDLLEQSLLRPGRLDKLVYVGPYCGVDEKTSVLRALCRSTRLRPEVELSSVAAALPERCTGADLLSVVACARAAARRRLVAALNQGAVKESTLSQDSVIIGVSELYEGVKAFRPSVTDEELGYYESLPAQL